MGSAQWIQSLAGRGGRSTFVACGLSNLGNTCFMNSCLQALANLVPLYYWLRWHYADCSKTPRPVGSWCINCDLAVLFHGMFSGAKVIRPSELAYKLESICSRFRLGRQEDSQEFLVQLLDKMERHCLDRPRLYGPQFKPLPFCELFRGRLVSRVHCTNCGHNSDKQDPLETLSLEISGLQLTNKSVLHALHQFTKTEILDGKNMYKCEKCKQAVRAEKRMLLGSPAQLLAIQLKRFSFTGTFARKLSDHISFDAYLNVGPFTTASLTPDQIAAAEAAEPGVNPWATTDKQGKPLAAPHIKIMYDLYGVLCHSGYSAQGGHYFEFSRPDPVDFPANSLEHNGAAQVHKDFKFYELNDSIRSTSPYQWENIRTREAYMLFYKARNPKLVEAIAKAAPPLPPPVKAAPPKQATPTAAAAASSTPASVSSAGKAGLSISTANKANALPPSSGSTASKPQPMIGPQLPPHLMQALSGSAAAPTGANAPAVGAEGDVEAAGQRTHVGSSSGGTWTADLNDLHADDDEDDINPQLGTPAIATIPGLGASSPTNVGMNFSDTSGSGINLSGSGLIEEFKQLPSYSYSNDGAVRTGLPLSTSDPGGVAMDVDAYPPGDDGGLRLKIPDLPPQSASIDSLRSLPDLDGPTGSNIAFGSSSSSMSAAQPEASTAPAQMQSPSKRAQAMLAGAALAHAKSSPQVTVTKQALPEPAVSLAEAAPATVSATEPVAGSETSASSVVAVASGDVAAMAVDGGMSAKSEGAGSAVSTISSLTIPKKQKPAPVPAAAAAAALVPQYALAQPVQPPSIQRIQSAAPSLQAQMQMYLQTGYGSAGGVGVMNGNPSFSAASYLAPTAGALAGGYGGAATGLASSFGPTYAGPPPRAAPPAVSIVASSQPAAVSADAYAGAQATLHSSQQTLPSTAGSIASSASLLDRKQGADDAGDNSSANEGRPRAQSSAHSTATGASDRDKRRREDDTSGGEYKSRYPAISAENRALLAEADARNLLKTKGAHYKLPAHEAVRDLERVGSTRDRNEDRGGFRRSRSRSVDSRGRRCRSRSDSRERAWDRGQDVRRRSSERYRDGYERRSRDRDLDRGGNSYRPRSRSHSRGRDEPRRDRGGDGYRDRNSRDDDFTRRRDDDRSRDRDRRDVDGGRPRAKADADYLRADDRKSARDDGSVSAAAASGSVAAVPSQRSREPSRAPESECVTTSAAAAAEGSDRGRGRSRDRDSGAKRARQPSVDRRVARSRSPPRDREPRARGRSRSRSGSRDRNRDRDRDGRRGDDRGHHDAGRRSRSRGRSRSGDSRDRRRDRGRHDDYDKRDSRDGVGTRDIPISRRTHQSSSSPPRSGVGTKRQRSASPVSAKPKLDDASAAAATTDVTGAEELLMGSMPSAVAAAAFAPASTVSSSFGASTSTASAFKLSSSESGSGTVIGSGDSAVGHGGTTGTPGRARSRFTNASPPADTNTTGDGNPVPFAILRNATQAWSSVADSSAALHAPTTAQPQLQITRSSALGVPAAAAVAVPASIAPRGTVASAYPLAGGKTATILKITTNKGKKPEAGAADAAVTDEKVAAASSKPFLAPKVSTVPAAVPASVGTASDINVSASSRSSAAVPVPTVGAAASVSVAGSTAVVAPDNAAVKVGTASAASHSAALSSTASTADSNGGTTASATSSAPPSATPGVTSPTSHSKAGGSRSGAKLVGSLGAVTAGLFRRAIGEVKSAAVAASPPAPHSQSPAASGASRSPNAAAAAAAHASSLRGASRDSSSSPVPLYGPHQQNHAPKGGDQRRGSAERGGADSAGGGAVDLSAASIEITISNSNDRGSSSRSGGGSARHSNNSRHSNGGGDDEWRSGARKKAAFIDPSELQDTDL